VPTIDAELLKSLTPMAVLLLVVLLVALGFIRGWIRTAVAISEVRADRDARLADKDAVIADKNEQIAMWRQAHRESEEAREVQADDLRVQHETTRATVELLRSLRIAGARGRDEESQ
jgi:hypothetical protein